MRQIWRDPIRVLGSLSAAVAFGACGWIAGGAPFGVGMASVVLITLLMQDSDNLQNGAEDGDGGRDERSPP
jgi:hypothetical protein